MRKGILRKGLVAGIIFLFIGASIVSGINTNSTDKSQSLDRGNWLYVGGSGPGNYTRIKDAVENASDGDTVFVYNGVYLFPYNTDYVRITKHISLIGENKYETILDTTNGPTDSIIDVRADSVTVCGFTIKGNGFGGMEGFHINGVQNVIIHDIILQYIYNGLYISDVNNSVFYNNTFLDSYWAIVSIDCKKCIFHNNTYYNNTIGMFLGGFGETIIAYNDFRKNYEGIHLHCISGENIIEYNNIMNNHVGIYFYHSTGIIRCNNIMRNAKSVRCISKIEKAEAIANTSLLVNREKWDKNYWGLFKTIFPKTIVAFAIIYIRIPDTTIALKNTRNTAIDFPLILAGMIPVWVVPTIQFDWHPAIQPYDIPRTAS